MTLRASRPTAEDLPRGYQFGDAALGIGDWRRAHERTAWLTVPASYVPCPGCGDRLVPDAICGVPVPVQPCAACCIWRPPSENAADRLARYQTEYEGWPI